MVRREMATRLVSAVLRSGFARRGLLAALALTALGCQPKIGDSCVTSSDCSTAGDRLCDTTQPSGYCTVFNCEPGTCPEDESICVAFGSERSLLPECASSTDTRLLRTFCMRTCKSDADCRNGYVCADLGGDNAWGAEVVETSLALRRACLLPPSGGAIDDNETEVCTGADSGSPAGAGGAAQAGSGQAGASGGGAAAEGGAAGAR